MDYQSWATDEEQYERQLDQEADRERDEHYDAMYSKLMSRGLDMVELAMSPGGRD